MLARRQDCDYCSFRNFSVVNLSEMWIVQQVDNGLLFFPQSHTYCSPSVRYIMESRNANEWFLTVCELSPSASISIALLWSHAVLPLNVEGTHIAIAPTSIRARSVFAHFLSRQPYLIFSQAHA